MSGTLMLYNKAPIMWKSKMQKTTAPSTAEAEYYYSASAVNDCVCSEHFLDLSPYHPAAWRRDRWS